MSYQIGLRLMLYTLIDLFINDLYKVNQLEAFKNCFPSLPSNETCLISSGSDIIAANYFHNSPRDDRAVIGFCNQSRW